MPHSLWRRLVVADTMYTLDGVKRGVRCTLFIRILFYSIQKYTSWVINRTFVLYTLQWKPIYLFLFWELRSLGPNVHIHVFASDLYISRIGPHISCSRIGRSIVGIYSINRSQTHECGNWDCGRAVSFLGSNFWHWFLAVQHVLRVSLLEKGVGGPLPLRDCILHPWLLLLECSFCTRPSNANKNPYGEPGQYSSVFMPFPSAALTPLFCVFMIRSLM